MSYVDIWSKSIFGRKNGMDKRFEVGMGMVGMMVKIIVIL